MQPRLQDRSISAAKSHEIETHARKALMMKLEVRKYCFVVAVMGEKVIPGSNEVTPAKSGAKRTDEILVYVEVDEEE
jgi:hypothetical protein